MSERAFMNEVRIAVRRNALLLKEFSVTEMVRACGLNPSSVRTELQRMKAAGFLSTCRTAVTRERAGRPPLVYRLTENPDMRVELSRSIETFYPQSSSSPKPTSYHYERVSLLIKEAQVTSNPDRENLLREARERIAYAEMAEKGDLASDSVRAYLRYQRARLLYLEGTNEKAEEEFALLQDAFAELGDRYTSDSIEEYLVCLKARRILLGHRTGHVDQEGMARSLIEAVRESGYQPKGPLASELLNLVDELSQSAMRRVESAVYKLSEALAHDVAEQVHERVRADTFRMSKFFMAVQTAAAQQGNVPGKARRPQLRRR